MPNLMGADWPAVSFTSHHIQGLSSLIADLRSAVGEFATAEGWKLAALDAGRNSRQGHSPWLSLLEKIEETEHLATESERHFLVHRPEVDGQSPLRPQVLLADEICNHFGSGGELAWITLLVHPAWKKAVSSCAFTGGIPRQRTRCPRFSDCLG